MYKKSLQLIKRVILQDFSLLWNLNLKVCVCEGGRKGGKKEEKSRKGVMRGEEKILSDIGQVTQTVIEHM